MNPQPNTPAPFARVVIVHGSSKESTPTYSLVINGDGRTLYKGRSAVQKQGRDEWRLSEETLLSMARVLHDSGVLKLGKGEGEGPSENAKLTVALKMPGAKPVVVDNKQDGQVLEDFVARIEKLAGLETAAGEA